VGGEQVRREELSPEINAFVPVCILCKPILSGDISKLFENAKPVGWIA